MFRIILFTSLLILQNRISWGQGESSSLGLSQVFSDYNAVLLDGDATAFDSSLSSFTRLSVEVPLSYRWYIFSGFTNGFRQNTIINSTLRAKSFSSAIDLGFLYKLVRRAPSAKQPLAVPYLSFGYQQELAFFKSSQVESSWISHSQYGIGMNFKLNDFISAQIQTTLDQQLGAEFNTHLQYRGGAIFNLQRKRQSENLIDEKLDYQNDQFNSYYNIDIDSILSIHDSLVLDIKSRELLLRALSEENEYQRKNIIALEWTIDSLLVNANRADVKNSNTNELVTNNDNRKGDYYVIISSTSRSGGLRIKSEAELLGYENVKLIPHSKGLFRVGILAGNSREQGILLLEKVKEEYKSDAWLYKY